MNSAASIDSYLTSRSQSRPRLSSVEIPIEAPSAGDTVTSSEPDQSANVFKEHCEDEFVFLAEQNPGKLAELIRTLQGRPSLLTFAAEAAGRIANTSLAVAILLPLLGQPDPVVREGAIYGLMPHLGLSLEARDALRGMAQADPSPGVVAAIQDALSVLD